MNLSRLFKREQAQLDVKRPGLQIVGNISDNKIYKKRKISRNSLFFRLKSKASLLLRRTKIKPLVEKGRKYESHKNLRKIKTVFKGSFRVILHSHIVQITFVAVILCVSLITARYFLLSQRFNIHTITIKNNSIVKTDTLIHDLQYLYKQNIFLVRSSRLESSIPAFSPYIKSVHVEKKLPDSIIITIEERAPWIVWMNWSGAYLVDREGVIVEVIQTFGSFELSSEDIDLLKGYVNSTKIEQEISNEQTQTKDEESKKELTAEEKNRIIEDQKKEVVSKVEQFWQQYESLIKGNYQSYTFIYNYDNTNYKVLDKVEQDIVDATRIILQSELFENEINRYLWESNFRFVIYLQQGRCIIFSMRRDFNIQIDDLEKVVLQLKRQGKQFHTIDLSSELIAYD